MSRNKDVKNHIEIFKYLFICSFVLTCILSGCISAFEPDGIKELDGMLVVEGIILEEGTTITLSRPNKITDQSNNFTDVSNAVIHIIDERNNIMAIARESAPGTYVANEKFTFIPEMKYALDIQVDNKHYQSAFVAPANTPEIDEVSWKLNEDKSIDIMVSTHGSENDTLYCLWSYKEDWEIRSYYSTHLRYDPDSDSVIAQSFWGDNRYYCWASDSSRSLIMASTDKFEHATIKDHIIHTLQPPDSRYSYLYSIEVKQYNLNREAVLYLENLQKNRDEIGSLFSPQPSEIKGNIRCLSDPGETVIGYIDVSKKSTSRLFIEMADLYLSYLEDQQEYCDDRFEVFISQGPRYAYYHYQMGPIVGYGISDCVSSGGGDCIYSYKPLPCVDCTRRGGTKTKPDFWPNDHR